jgi:hypothetical protein
MFGRNLRCQPVRGVATREECHWVTRMQELQAEEQRRETQWHSFRVQISVEKRAPYSSDDPNPNTAESRVENAHRTSITFLYISNSVLPSVLRRNSWLGLGLELGFGLQPKRLSPSEFGRLQCKSVRGSGLPRGLALVTRMQELKANMRGIQWHPRV